MRSIEPLKEQDVMYTVSVIMPVYNESRFIVPCIRSLLKQDYPKEQMEWILVDGMSTDDTVRLIEKFRRQYPRMIRILHNPDQTVPYAMNIGIRASGGKYIIRLDAHADYPCDYISKCVHYLDTMDIDNVGGIAMTKAEGRVGRAIAKVLSSKFGVGNSRFRTEAESGYVDTVAFGAFRRSVFEKYGEYDERLTRNQDNELNYRIRKNGGKIYLASDISFTYYCRDSFRGIAEMAFQNGTWNVVTMKLCPGSMSVRHFVPLLFVLSLSALPFAGIKHKGVRRLLQVELSSYFLLDAMVSLRASEDMKEGALMFLIFPTFHTAYGIGSLNGIKRVLSKELKKFS